MTTVVYPRVGGQVTAPNYLGQFLWANKPAATAVPGATIYVTNFGASGGGSYWYSDGVRWRASGNCVRVYSSIAPAATSSGTEQVLHQSSLIPADGIQNGDTIRIKFSGQKSAGVATETMSLRIGTTSGSGATADSLAYSFSQPSGASTTIATQQDVMRASATVIRPLNISTAAPWQQTTLAYPSDSSALANSLATVAQYLSVCFASTGSETITTAFCTIEILT